MHIATCPRATGLNSRAEAKCDLEIDNATIGTLRRDNSRLRFNRQIFVLIANSTRFRVKEQGTVKSLINYPTSLRANSAARSSLARS